MAYEELLLQQVLGLKSVEDINVRFQDLQSCSLPEFQCIISSSQHYIPPPPSPPPPPTQILPTQTSTPISLPLTLEPLSLKNSKLKIKQEQKEQKEQHKQQEIKHEQQPIRRHSTIRKQQISQQQEQEQKCKIEPGLLDKSSDIKQDDSLDNLMKKKVYEFMEIICKHPWKPLIINNNSSSIKTETKEIDKKSNIEDSNPKINKDKDKDDINNDSEEEDDSNDDHDGAIYNDDNQTDNYKDQKNSVHKIHSKLKDIQDKCIQGVHSMLKSNEKLRLAPATLLCKKFHKIFKNYYEETTKTIVQGIITKNWKQMKHQFANVSANTSRSAFDVLMHPKEKLNFIASIAHHLQFQVLEIPVLTESREENLRRKLFGSFMEYFCHYRLCCSRDLSIHENSIKIFQDELVRLNILCQDLHKSGHVTIGFHNAITHRFRIYNKSFNKHIIGL